MLSHLFDGLWASAALERAQWVARSYEVDLYTFYLDVWWEVQFALEPSLLGPQLGC